jgi:5S rRNA maturation endonuclease (ribonuclease M5)
MNWNKVNNDASVAILESDRLDELLADLGLNLTHVAGTDVYRGACPVHGGDDHNFQLKTGGDKLPIYWSCFSRHCEKVYKHSLLGLVRGILSYQRNGVLVEDLQKAVSLQQALAYLKEFVARLPVERQPKPKPAPQCPSAWTRVDVQRRLDIPCPHLVRQGFSPAVLRAFDVGRSRKLELRDYSLFPLYDDDGERYLGHLLRCKRGACSKCKCYHHPRYGCYSEGKWRLSKGFAKSDYLYGYAHARRYDACPFVLLVEGAKEVLRLAEVAVPAVAVLGNELLRGQAAKLAALSNEVILAFDNDQPGQTGAEQALADLAGQGVAARSITPPPKYKDIGEMPAAEVAVWLEDCGVQCGWPFRQTS